MRLSLAVLVLMAACARPARRASAEYAALPSTDPAIRDQDIAFYEARLREDPWSAADRSRLSGLYLARSRDHGDYRDVARAESLAVQSLAGRASHNGNTWGLVASARLARHDFAGALQAARNYVGVDGSATSRAMLGEVLLEVGAYDEARGLFAPLERDCSQPTIAARVARWYELTGRIGEAQRMARYAANSARQDGGLSREQIAWFELRVGDLALKRGQLDDADSAFALGLRINPGDYRLLAGVTRLEAARGEWRRAVAAGEMVIEVQPDPATLGTMADAWRSLGDTAQAESYARAMTASALTQPGAIHRAWGLYLVDHGQQVDEVVRRVREEQRTRGDVYGFDLLAWALHAQGRDAEAWRAAQRALSQGTEDAQLVWHASVIARAVGDTAQASALTARVRAINPVWRR